MVNEINLLTNKTKLNTMTYLLIYKYLYGSEFLLSMRHITMRWNLLASYAHTDVHLILYYMK